MKNKNTELLYLDEAEVESLVSYEDVLELVEISFREYSLGNAVNPIKLHLPIYPDYEGYINSMPAYLKRQKIVGSKIVSVFSDNPKKFGIPSTIGTVLLFDVETGRPNSIMGGTYITDARTGAVMGIMAKYLAKPISEVLTVVGAGAQGLSGFNMIQLALHSIREVRVVDINPDAQDNFIKQASHLFPDISYVKYGGIQDACKNADMVLAAASSKTPLFDDIQFDKGTTVLVIEGGTSNKVISKVDQFICDFKECFIERANASIQRRCSVTGESEIEMEAVTGEIGDIIAGKIGGRKNNEEIILAASVGMGIQDIIVGQAAYERAIQSDMGTVLKFLKEN